MAEAFVNFLFGDAWTASSAGTRPALAVSPLAIRAMAEVGVDIGGQRPKHVDTLAHEPWDLVVTVCDSARESCPAFPQAGEQIHLSFPDPALATGTEDERMTAYRAVRDDIRARLLPELARRAATESDAGS
jgi:arsenate reductase (thioredoxin)